MYRNGAILAVLVLAYSALSGRLARTWISGPMLFVAAGVALGPLGLGLLQLNLAAEGLRAMAEFTLAMVLFTGAANADFAVLRRNVGIPERLLLVGLPLTILAGFLAARAIFPDLSLVEAALLAAIVAPTDAALGVAVVSSPDVPAPIREGLNAESGLNDGICVPLVAILLEIAIGTEIEGSSIAHMAMVVLEEIGLGALVGLAVTLPAIRLLDLADRHGWEAEGWRNVPAVAVAAICFSTAQAIGGSGFIACFVGGLWLSPMARPWKHSFLRGADSTGETLALITWAAFGAGVVGQIMSRITWAALAYAVLSLTVVRIMPVLACLMNTGLTRPSKWFIGWFGPRGLATIVFGVIVASEHLPGNSTIISAAVCTVVLSVVAHGMTANPLVRALQSRTGANP